MTGPRPFTRPENAFVADQELRKKDNDPRPKDSYEPSNKRGSGAEREYPRTIPLTAGTMKILKAAIAELRNS